MFEGGPAATLTSSRRYAPTALWVAALTLVCCGSAPPGAAPCARRSRARATSLTASATRPQTASLHAKDEKCVRQIYFLVVFRHYYRSTAVRGNPARREGSENLGPIA
jgi:hypothetical protein